MLPALTLGSIVATASSIRACSPTLSSYSSTVGIRWQLMPTVVSTLYARSPRAGRSDTPTSGARGAGTAVVGVRGAGTTAGGWGAAGSGGGWPAPAGPED